MMAPDNPRSVVECPTCFKEITSPKPELCYECLTEELKLETERADAWQKVAKSLGYNKEEDSMLLTPLTHRVLIRPDKPEEVTSKGIILPPGVQSRKQCQGEVVSTGPGRQTDDGKTIPMTVKKGQKVIYGEYSTVPIELNGEKFLLISEADILAIVN